MPSWNELLEEAEQLSPKAKSEWLRKKKTAALAEIGRLRGDTNVLFYASAFLQKPRAPGEVLQVNSEDLNGFMSVLYGMDWNKPLTMLLHTPGGSGNAAETIVRYLRSKFQRIEVIVPAYAMSAGTMMSLAADKIVMGRQSQLGPIDPQMMMGGSMVSARAVVDQFERAKAEILANPNTARVWAPTLQTLGPALLQQADFTLKYGENMVAAWLANYMFHGNPRGSAMGAAVAQHFNDASAHKSHGRRIDRDEARQQGLSIEDLEANQQLQEQVLTAYHLVTITFERSLTTKLIASSQDRYWIKSWGEQVQ